jgi:hypothetical protein
MLKIETNQIKAAMECVVTEKNDPRFYLRGVLLEITACGDVHLVSTDGERLFFGRIPAAKVQWTDGRIEGHAQIILPYDALKKGVSATRRFGGVVIGHRGDNAYSINGMECEALKGYFPDWRKVAEKGFKTIKAECPPMDWGRVATVEKALREWSGNKTATVRVNGIGADGVGALVAGDDHNAFALVMPQKTKEITPIITPNFPAALEAEKV